MYREIQPIMGYPETVPSLSEVVTHGIEVKVDVEAKFLVADDERALTDFVHSISPGVISVDELGLRLDPPGRLR